MGNDALDNTSFYPLRFAYNFAAFASVAGQRQGLARSVCMRLIGAGTSKDTSRYRNRLKSLGWQKTKANDWNI